MPTHLGCAEIPECGESGRIVHDRCLHDLNGLRHHVPPLEGLAHTAEALLDQSQQQVTKGQKNHQDVGEDGSHQNTGVGAQTNGILTRKHDCSGWVSNKRQLNTKHGYG